MQERRSYWWILPVSLIGLVVFFEAANLPKSPAAAPKDRNAAAEAAVSRPGRAVLQDANGQRSAPFVLPQESAALVLDLGKDVGQQRVSLRLWRRDAEGARLEPAWLRATPRVRGDGTLPIGGLVAGSYDVEIEVARGGESPLAGHADGIALAAGGLLRQALPLAAVAAAPGR